MKLWTSVLPATLLTGILAFAPLAAQQPVTTKAKNVILFLADAGGIPTLNAASILGYNAPQKLFVQSWPYVGLSDTSTASEWVTDSAAGMTAIVTGQKTHNGVISQGADTQRKSKDGMALKTLLEYAEEKGLSTGVMTNVNIADATPAANYAHANDRGKFGEIILQVFNPRFGDGVDFLMGAGRKPVYDGVKALGQDLDAVAKRHNRPVYSTLSEVPAGTQRPIVIAEELDIPAAARMAIKNLSQNPKGYFLQIEWDAHTDDPERGLNNIVKFDKLIRELSTTVNMSETLFVFTADHSFELRTHGGLKTDPVLKGFDEWKKAAHARNEVVDLPVLRVGHSHTGEEVLAAAMGPGAEQVHGYMPNTHLFEIMMNALGWQK